MDNTKKPVRDPICGMRVDPESTPHKFEHEGRNYYFCSENCQRKYRRQVAPLSADRETVRDVICGMLVNTAETTHVYDQGGARYYFCSEGCLKIFERKASRIFKQKGFFGRWLERLERANESQFGGGGPRCH